MNKLFFENILPGTLLFSRFVLIRCLSAGLLGGVYLCKDKEKNESLVALKVFSTTALKEKRLAENFEQERQLSFKVAHHHVVSFQDFYTDDDFTAFSMEYVDGGTLADFIARGEVVPVPTILNLLSQIAQGLHAIHAHDIVHRDLKPENILLTSSGTLKITDFGIASTHGGADSYGDQGISGTVNYLSPEYIASGSFDARSDIYAFGVIAYELMTGHTPFGGNGLIDTLIARVRFDPASPRAVRADIPRSLSELALKSMKRAPEKRYQTSEELVESIKMIQSIETHTPSRQRIQISEPKYSEMYSRRPALPEAA